MNSNVQSASAVLARLLTDAPPDAEWRPVDVPGPYRALHLLLVATLAAGPALACLRPRGGDPEGAEGLEFCLALCLAVLASPVSWTHYYLLLLAPAALWLGGRLPGSAGVGPTACAALGLVLMAPPVLDLAPAGAVARLLVSHYWAGGVLLLRALTAARWRAGAGRPALRLFPPTPETWPAEHILARKAA
jgi:hypothetical protein